MKSCAIKKQYTCKETLKVDKEGNHWYYDGVRHREHGPAIDCFDGYKEWWQYGKLHREDGPAIEDGIHLEWWVRGKLHRLDGPAVYWGTRQEYWVNDNFHRLDGPAVEDDDGEEWWFDGKKHRENGPAIIIRNEGIITMTQWWVHDVRFSPEKERILNCWWGHDRRD